MDEPSNAITPALGDQEHPASTKPNATIATARGLVLARRARTVQGLSGFFKLFAVPSAASASIDSFHLSRFLDTQAGSYEKSLGEIRRGAKRSHWMWYIFPQIAGLGRSPMALRYAIQSLDEARAYLAHPVLGQRLRDCVAALQDLSETTADAVFGATDAMKLRSSLTLFQEAGGGPLFSAALKRWFGGVPDTGTIALLGECAGEAD